MIPTKFFLTKGKGIHKEKLIAYEFALREAGISHLNLVSVSSILPPGCKKISKEKGITLLKPGEITFCVLARNETNEPNRLISASVGYAIPTEVKSYGYLSEHHSFDETKRKASEYAEYLAISMLVSSLGIKFNFDVWKKRKKFYKLNEKVFYTSNITETARGKEGLWTVVLAAAVFVP